MDDKVQQLVSDYRAGAISRRKFLTRAVQLLGGAAAANALLLAAAGAPIRDVAAAAGALQGTAAPTPAATKPATDGGLEIQTSMIKFKTRTDEAPGYLARPTAAGTYPGVVVIQEWWGVDDHIKNVTERFAHKGYVALAPDLYRGEVAKEPTDAQRLVMKVQRMQALQDIQGAVDYLDQQDMVLPHKAGVIGFCFGGGLAMMTSYLGKGIGAVVVLYGAGVDPTDDEFQKVSAPVLGLYGDQDPGFTAAKINGWGDKFKQFGKINEMVIYKGAAHAFFNDTRASYNQAAAQDSWIRALAWFQKYLVADTQAAGTMQATMSATQAAK